MSLPRALAAGLIVTLVSCKGEPPGSQAKDFVFDVTAKNVAILAGHRPESLPEGMAEGVRAYHLQQEAWGGRGTGRPWAVSKVCRNRLRRAHGLAGTGARVGGVRRSREEQRECEGREHRRIVLRVEQCERAAWGASLRTA